MHVTKSVQGTVAVLTIRDALVVEELTELEDVLQDCMNGGLFRIVMDMRSVPFIDSAGLEMLQDLTLDLGKRGGDLRVTMLNDICKDIFVATRMDSFIQESDDQESAIRSLV